MVSPLTVVIETEMPLVMTVSEKKGNCLQLGYVSANHSPVLISSTNSVFVFTHYVSVVCSLYYLFCLFVPKNYSNDDKSVFCSFCVILLYSF